MKGEVSDLVLRQLVELDLENLAGLLSRIDRIDDDDSSRLRLAQDEIEKDLPHPCAGVDDRDTLRQNTPSVKVLGDVRPKPVVTKKDIPAPQNDDVFIHGLQRLHRVYPIPAKTSSPGQLSVLPSTPAVLTY